MSEGCAAQRGEQASEQGPRSRSLWTTRSCWCRWPIHARSPQRYGSMAGGWLTTGVRPERQRQAGAGDCRFDESARGTSGLAVRSCLPWERRRLAIRHRRRAEIRVLGVNFYSGWNPATHVAPGIPIGAVVLEEERRRAEQQARLNAESEIDAKANKRKRDHLLLLRR
jgi:hypothetical protein